MITRKTLSKYKYLFSLLAKVVGCCCRKEDALSNRTKSFHFCYFFSRYFQSKNLPFLTYPVFMNNIVCTQIRSY